MVTQNIETREGEGGVECPADGCTEQVDVRRGGRTEESRTSMVVSCSPLSTSWTEYPSNCVRCGHLLFLEPSQAYTAETQPVFLYCSPPDHAFCSKQCLRSYVESCTDYFRLDVSCVTCPVCFVGVEKELVYDCYGGEELYQILEETERLSRMDAGVCMECKNHKGETLMCGHVFCAQCRFGWSSKVLFRHCGIPAIMPCPVCNQPTGVHARSRLGRIYDYVRSSFLGS